MTERELERFNKHVTVADNGCLIWGASIRNGYGQLGLKRDGKYVTPATHRLAYEHYIGEITPGLTLDHLCRNRACCNPSHLEPVTRGENVLRGIGPAAENRRKTHCKYGHELSGDNLMLERRSGGIMRRCVTCRVSGRLRRYASKPKAHRDNASKTHCLKGHPFAGDNLGLYTRPGRRTERYCRICKRNSGRQV